MKFLFKYMMKHKAYVIASFLLITLSVVSLLVQPKLFEQVIGSIVSRNTDDILRYGSIILVIAVIGLVASILNTVIAARISQEVGSDIRQDFFDKVQSFSYSNVEEFQASNLTVRLTNDSQQAQGLVMMLLQTLTRIPIMFIGSFVMALITMPNLWWFILMIIALVVGTVTISFGFMGPRFGKIQKYIERINEIAKENFSGMRVVKSFVQEDHEIEKFNIVSDKLTRETVGVGYVFGFMMPMFFLIMDGGIAFLLFIIGGSIGTDPALIASTVSFISYVVNIMMALMIGGMMISFSSRATVSVKRILQVMNTESDMAYVSESDSVSAGSYVFKDVTYTYPNDEKATLNHLSFEINAGDTIGIVGATGAGKSTLVNLFARIADPISGSILLDGKDIKSYADKELRSAVSVVLQRPVLFFGTIADNIRQGKEDASLDEIKWAAGIAQAAEFIEVLPGKYDSEVFERGANFSGGQKQRISIARGLISKPRVLILDDSTSALDAHSEKLVRQGLIEAMKGTTQIIISQKISSIVHADKILVFDEGHLVSSGTHDWLIENSDVYLEIFETQKGRDSVDLEAALEGMA